MKNKIETEYLEYMWPMRHFLVTCGKVKEKDIVAISFCMPVSKNPPLIACAIGKGFYSSELIEKYREFIVNVPPREMNKQIQYCGSHSGRIVDKFKETGLTMLKGRNVSAPAIGECVAHIECKVVNKFDTGDKNLFIGQAIEAYADEDVVNKTRKVAFAKGGFPRHVYSIRTKSAEP